MPQHIAPAHTLAPYVSEVYSPHALVANGYPHKHPSHYSSAIAVADDGTTVAAVTMHGSGRCVKLLPAGTMLITDAKEIAWLQFPAGSRVPAFAYQPLEQQTRKWRFRFGSVDVPLPLPVTDGDRQVQMELVVTVIDGITRLSFTKHEPIDRICPPGGWPIAAWAITEGTLDPVPVARPSSKPYKVTASNRGVPGDRTLTIIATGEQLSLPGGVAQRAETRFGIAQKGNDRWLAVVGVLKRARKSNGRYVIEYHALYNVGTGERLFYDENFHIVGVVDLPSGPMIIGNRLNNPYSILPDRGQVRRWNAHRRRWERQTIVPGCAVGDRVEVFADGLLFHSSHEVHRHWVGAERACTFPHYSGPLRRLPDRFVSLQYDARNNTLNLRHYLIA